MSLTLGDRCSRITMVRFHLLYLFIFGTTSAGSPQPMFRSLGLSVTNAEAEHACSILGGDTWSLPVPDNVSDAVAFHKRLTSFMGTSRVKHAWISVRGKKLNQWRVSGRFRFCGQISQINNIQGKHCTLLRPRGQFLIPFYCNGRDVDFGYVCELPASIGCPLWFSGHYCECKQPKGPCYIFGPGVSSWFEANNLCYSIGAQLVAVRSDKDVRALSRLFDRSVLSRSLFWVDVVDHVWEYHFFDNRSAFPDIYFWYKDQPTPERNCVIVRKYQKGFLWKAVHCHSRHQVICMNTRAQPHSVTSVSTSPVQDAGTSLNPFGFRHRQHLHAPADLRKPSAREQAECVDADISSGANTEPNAPYMPYPGGNPETSIVTPPYRNANDTADVRSFTSPMIPVDPMPIIPTVAATQSMWKENSPAHPSAGIRKPISHTLLLLSIIGALPVCIP